MTCAKELEAPLSASNEFSLNEGQTIAANKLREFLADDDENKSKRRFFTLTGDPGTGKTYMVKSVLPELRQPIVCATISHAAKLVLENAIDKQARCITIAKLLGMRPKVNLETGEQEFIPDKHSIPEILDYKTVILDEVSMINNSIADLILEYVETQGIDLICLGDKHQLSPVGQEEDSLFLEHPDAELTETMRFDDRIGKVTKTFKDQIQLIHNDLRPNFKALDVSTKRKSDYDPTSDSGVKFTKDAISMLDEVVARLKTHPEDIYNCRVLVYRNNTVKKLNDYIRAKLYRDKKQFHYNELLIANNSFEAYDHRSGSPVSLIHNGELLRVDEYEPITHKGIPCYSLTFIGKDSEGLLIPVVQNTQVATAMYQKELNRLANNAKTDPKQWIAYYRFKDSFADFTYGNVMNTHKAQGASINHVYVAEGEIMGVTKAPIKNKFQSLYVACSRAKQSLTIYKNK